MQNILKLWVQIIKPMKILFATIPVLSLIFQIQYELFLIKNSTRVSKFITTQTLLVTKYN